MVSGESSERKQLPAATVAVECVVSRHATFSECPLCGGGMAPEHAHYRCGSCGWRDSCCD